MWLRWALVGFVLLCAGCELALDVAVEVDRDGGGRLEVALTADEDLRARADAAGADPLGDLAATGEELSEEGWAVEDTIDADGLRTVSLSAGFDEPEAFDRLAADLAGALAAPEVELLSPLTLTVEDDRLVVDGAASLEPTPVVAEHGLTPEQAVDLLRDGGTFTYTVHVALPGQVLDSTAAVEGEGALRWTVPPGERVAIHAVGERPGPPVWPLVVGGVVGLLVGALVARRLVVVRRRAQ